MEKFFPIQEKKIINKSANLLVISVSYDPFSKTASGTIGLKNEVETSEHPYGLTNDWLYQEPFQKVYLDSTGLDEQVKKDAQAILSVVFK